MLLFRLSSIWALVFHSFSSVLFFLLFWDKDKTERSKRRGEGMKRRRRGRSGGRRRNTTQRDLHFEANHHPPLPFLPTALETKLPPFPFFHSWYFWETSWPPPPELQKKNGPGHKRGGGGSRKGRWDGRDSSSSWPDSKKHINSLFPLDPRFGLGLPAGAHSEPISFPSNQHHSSADC